MTSERDEFFSQIISLSLHMILSLNLIGIWLNYNFPALNGMATVGNGAMIYVGPTHWIGHIANRIMAKREENQSFFRLLQPVHDYEKHK